MEELLKTGEKGLKCQNVPDILGFCRSPGQGLHKDKPWTRFADHHHHRHHRHRHCPRHHHHHRHRHHHRHSHRPRPSLA